MIVGRCRINRRDAGQCAQDERTNDVNSSRVPALKVTPSRVLFRDFTSHLRRKRSIARADQSAGRRALMQRGRATIHTNVSDLEATDRPGHRADTDVGRINEHFIARDITAPQPSIISSPALRGNPAREGAGCLSRLSCSSSLSSRGGVCGLRRPSATHAQSFFMSDVGLPASSQVGRARELCRRISERPAPRRASSATTASSRRVIAAASSPPHSDPCSLHRVYYRGLR